MGSVPRTHTLAAAAIIGWLGHGPLAACTDRGHSVGTDHGAQDRRDENLRTKFAHSDRPPSHGWRHPMSSVRLCSAVVVPDGSDKLTARSPLATRRLGGRPSASVRKTPRSERPRRSRGVLPESWRCPDVALQCAAATTTLTAATAAGERTARRFSGLPTRRRGARGLLDVPAARLPGSRLIRRARTRTATAPTRPRRTADCRGDS
jgi:hypothetical protein